jgi:peptidyl-prolyl isomerase G (cyclophilin G)
LEREETERLAAARKCELERLSRQREQEVPSTNGVRFKGLFYYPYPLPSLMIYCIGRGRMKFVDPELHRRR